MSNPAYKISTLECYEEDTTTSTTTTAKEVEGCSIENAIGMIAGDGELRACTTKTRSRGTVHKCNVECRSGNRKNLGKVRCRTFPRKVGKNKIINQWTTRTGQQIQC